ncbi:hypothetical protein ASC90_27185 [Rhizobium sp. Root1220]|nr:hypothetical protein ASC90_27185 [Rhizobium sp. Root1220]
MIVLLSGPTGTGKTSFASALADWGYTALRESIPEPIFQRFRNDPRSHCAELQAAIIHARVAAWKSLRVSEKIVFDRSIDEDASIFCRMHFENGLLSRDEYDALAKLAKEAEQEVPKPDLTIFLRGPVEPLLARLRATGHPSVIIDSLPRQLDLYDQWIAAQTGPILQMDNTRCTLESFGKFIASR